MQLHNVGFARASDGTVKYKVDGSRMSGDMNTALGNCLIMCALCHAYARHAGIRARLLNNGDDCVLIMERSDYAKVSDLGAWFLDRGFTMKVERPESILECVSFCQTHCLHLGDGKHRMVRNPHVALAKDSCSTLPLTQGNMVRKYLGTLGDAGMALNSGVPVFQEYFAGLSRESRGMRLGQTTNMECGMMNLAKGMVVCRANISAAARLSFYLAFGITPDYQLALEEFHASWAFDPTVAHRVFGADRTYPLDYR
jgi:hypothetical protein